jgi:hypothetical protein
VFFFDEFASRVIVGWLSDGKGVPKSTDPADDDKTTTQQDRERETEGKGELGGGRKEVKRKQKKKAGGWETAGR